MKFVVLDFETTGGSASRDEIIQVGLVVLDEQLNIAQTFSRYVKPSQAIPDYITVLTGIRNEDVADAPPIDEVLLEMLPLLEEGILVAHNVSFDLAFLDAALDHAGYNPYDGPKLDSIKLIRMLYPTLPSYSLGAVTEALGVLHEHHHRADSDALATAELVALCMRKLLQLPLLTLQRLAAIYANSSSNMAWFLTQVIVRREQLFAQGGLEGISVHDEPSEYAYHRQFALAVEEWSSEQPPRTQLEDLDSQLAQVEFIDFASELKANIRKQLKHYEEREAQNIMIDRVYAALEQEQHLFVEAGTGTGKSLGYLIPALYYGIKHNQKIVISTHTINLQEQLRSRDLPLLNAVMPVPFRATVFKGRNNYICMRKFEQKVSSSDYTHAGDDRLTAAQMVVWLTETEHGDQEELNFASRGQDFWSSIASDTDSCLNRACPWFKRCYYHRAKHEANLSDVIITNHSMLFTDLRAEHRLLPTYQHLIVDEAHHLEDVASKHLGVHLQYNALAIPLVRLARDARNGLLPTLSRMLKSEDPEHADDWRATISELMPLFGEMRDDWEALFESLYRLASVGSSDGGGGEQGLYTRRVRPTKLPVQWDDLLAHEARLYANLGTIVRTMDKLFTAIRDRGDDYKLMSFITDMSGLLRDLARVREDLRAAMHVNREDLVYWVEANSNNRVKSVQAFAVPIEVKDHVRRAFFENKQTVICTSATLTVQQKFDYVLEQLGADEFYRDGGLDTVQLQSPFDYREQALVIIPRDFPLMKGYQGERQFVRSLVDSLVATAVATGGRMLVLFTSYRMLKNVHEMMKPLLDEQGVQLYGQGVDSGNRSKLTRLFQDQPRSVLLGTSSFWEGVVIPGDALSVLAIVRLPFQPPNHPILEAKSELIEAQGDNPFMKLSVPQAVIRFKQGFGRLVRSQNDHGVVIVYDTRVTETRYGKYFLTSLPGPRIESMPTSQVVHRVRDWLALDELQVGDEHYA